MVVLWTTVNGEVKESYQSESGIILFSKKRTKIMIKDEVVLVNPKAADNN